jgi:hypothetical protein
MPSSIHSLFRTIPQQDYLHLFNKKGEPDVKKVIGCLDYEKKDISIATNIPTTSIRYDEKMPAELKQRAMEWATALNLVAGYFRDQEKTLLWFRTPNPLLGDITPRDMIRIGRFPKLLRFIQTALDENER